VPNFSPSADERDAGLDAELLRLLAKRLLKIEEEWRSRRRHISAAGGELRLGAQELRVGGLFGH
jgi:hypothetical protein